MKKLHFILMCLMFVSIGLFACDTKAPGDTVTTTGETTAITDSSKKPSVTNLKETGYMFVGKLLDLSSYEVSGTGELEIQKGYYSQKMNISEEYTKTKDVYYKSTIISDSNSMNQGVFTTAVNKDKVTFRTSEENSYITTPIENYKNVYGNLPTENFFGLILNDNTILSCGVLSSITTNISIEYTLDPGTSTALMAKEIQERDHLLQAPSFKKVTLILVMTQNWEELHFVITVEYSGVSDEFGALDYTQTCNYTISQMNKVQEIPYEEIIKEAFNQDVIEIEPYERIPQDNPAMDLLDAFTQLDCTKGLLMMGKMNLEAQGTTMEFPLAISFQAKDPSQIQSENGFKLKAETEINSTRIIAYYQADQYLYVSVGNVLTKYDLSVLSQANTYSTGSNDLSQLFLVEEIEENQYHLTANVDALNSIFSSYFEFTALDIQVVISSNQPSTIVIEAETSLGNVSYASILQEASFEDVENLDAYTEVGVIELVQSYIGVFNMVSPFVNAFMNDGAIHLSIDFNLYVGGQKCSYPTDLSISVVADENSQMGVLVQAYIDLSDSMSYKVLSMMLNQMFTEDSYQFIDAIKKEETTNEVLLDKLLVQYDGFDTLVIQGIMKDEVITTDAITINQDTPVEEMSMTGDIASSLPLDIVYYVLTQGFTFNANEMYLDITEITSILYSMLIEQIPEDSKSLLINNYLPEDITKARFYYCVTEDGIPQVDFIMGGTMKGNYSTLVQIQITLVPNTVEE